MGRCGVCAKRHRRDGGDQPRKAFIEDMTKSSERMQEWKDKRPEIVEEIRANVIAGKGRILQQKRGYKARKSVQQSDKFSLVLQANMKFQRLKNYKENNGHPSKNNLGHKIFTALDPLTRKPTKVVGMPKSQELEDGIFEGGFQAENVREEADGAELESDASEEEVSKFAEKKNRVTRRCRR